jgi:hypothetical protein
MKKKNLLVNTMFCAALLCGAVTVAQEPVINISPERHANLAAAQRLVAQANDHIRQAQKDNRYDMHGHAERARNLLVEVNNELKLAAEDANH